MRNEIRLSRNADELRAELERVRAQADEDRISAHDLAIQFETRRSSKDSASQGLARMQSQLNHFRSREQEILRNQLEQSQAPLETNKAELERQLQIRVDVETELADSRRRVEIVENELREFDQRRECVSINRSRNPELQ